MRLISITNRNHVDSTVVIDVETMATIKIYNVDIRYF